MQTFAMKCSVCHETFDFERDVLPLDEATPPHAPVYPGKPRVDMTCMGTGQVLIPPKL